MNVSPNITKDYENLSNSTLGENKPNSNPISEKPKMNVKSIVTKNYENICPCGAPKNKPNSNPISQEPKNKPKLIVDKGLSKSALRSVPKNKPNFKTAEFAIIMMLALATPYFGVIARNRKSRR